jgi:hypothetical protein
MSDDMFDFEDVMMDVPAGLGVAAPPPRLAGSIDHPRGALCESSPACVASEATGGGRGNEGVRLLLVRETDDVCGGEIKGGGTVIRFCSEPRDTCDTASHAKGKALLKRGCLHPCVPKKGNNQVRLEPSLPLSVVPRDETLDMLPLEEKSIALWQTCMDSCKASEFKTGRNELGVLSSGGSWGDDLGEAPSLQDLVDADDFKTPKKVRIIPSLSREADEDH